MGQERTQVRFEEIKERVDLRDVIQLEAERWHDGYKSGLCPFHDDHSPSFLVYPDHFVCLAASCGVHGDLIDWIAMHEGLADWGEIKDRALGLASGVRSMISLPVAREEVHIEPLPGLMPDGVLDQFGMGVDTPEAQRFMSMYLLEPDALARYMIGYSSRRSAYVIPVLADGIGVITLRFRRDDHAHIERWEELRGPKYFGVRGRNAVYMFNRQVLVPEVPRLVFYAFGEMTALFITERFGPCVSHTNGAGAFADYLFEPLVGVGELVLVPDTGEEDQAMDVAERAVAHGISASVVFLPALLPFGNDVIDWFREYGGTGQAWHRVFDERVSAGGVHRAFVGRMADWWER